MEVFGHNLYTNVQVAHFEQNNTHNLSDVMSMASFNCLLKNRMKLNWTEFTFWNGINELIWKVDSNLEWELTSQSNIFDWSRDFILIG